MAKMEDDGRSFNMLHQLEQILESDPLIDEVGHIHPTQLAALNKEADVDADGLKFWLEDHKLGISTGILFQLYKQAKEAFFDAITQYKMQCNLIDNNEDENFVHYCSEPPNTLENALLKHSRALLLLSSDFGTAWNSRKLIIRKKDVLTDYMYEFQLSELILSYSPKSDQAWSHRRWLIKAIAGKVSDLPQIVGRESKLVERIAKRLKMNYRAWNHRCWLVQFMTEEQVLHELKESKSWAGLNVADSSCFHYRKMLSNQMNKHDLYHYAYDVCSAAPYDEDSGDSSIKKGSQGDDFDTEIYGIWKEELAWGEDLIKRYIGREALWLYRRFLSLCWLRHLTTEPGSDIIFLENEVSLVHGCLNIPDSDYDDFEAQAMHSTAYVLWLAKQIPRSQGRTLLRKSLRLGDMKVLLDKYWPKRSFFVDSLEELLSPSNNSLGGTSV